jgi:hypothetical protein
VESQIINTKRKPLPILLGFYNVKFALTKKKKKMNLKSKDPKVQQQEEELYQKLEAKKVSMPHKVNVSKKKVSCSV